MGSTHKTPYFFQSKPIFGLDIGKGSLKILQLANDDSAKPHLVAYGSTTFDSTAIEDGVILQPEIVAKAAQNLFRKDMVGELTTRHVAMAIPSYRTYTRSMQLPSLKSTELEEAVRLEAEQYIPVSLDELYLDYTVISSSDDGIEVLVVAVPKEIVDSYLTLTSIMGLEAVLIEPTMSANGRLFARDDQSDVASVIIDFGTITADISIYDHGIVTTGTVEGGGQMFNQAIENKLKVSSAEAAIIKSKYGLGKSRRQAEIQAALDPTLKKIVTEIKRLTRYHSDHYGTERPIQQVVTLGGGASMPGLSDYFTSSLRLAVRTLDPWQGIELGRLQPPNAHDGSLYGSAIGLSLTPPHEVFS